MTYKTYTLGEISNSISYGYTASASEEKIGPKFLRITDIRGRFIDWDTVPYCEIDENNFQKNKLEYGDIVIARTGATTGINAVIDEEGEGAVYASYLIRFKINQSIANPFYVGYLMKTYEWDGFVNGIIGGSAQPGANAKQFAKFSFQLPPLEIQNQAVSTLQTIEEKMKLNGQINTNLEQLALAIYKQWFVNFDFPDEFGNYYRTNGGEMVESELGQIPVGWKVIPTSEFGQFKNGINYNRDTSGDSYYNVCNVRNIVGPSFFVKNKLEVLSIDANKADSYTVEAGDTLIVRSASPGETVFINKAEKETIYSGFVIRFRPKQMNHALFMFFYFYRLREMLDAYSTGTTLKNLNQQILKATKVIFPTVEIIDKFNQSAQPIINMMDEIKKENEKLVALFNALLPTMLAGKVTLSSAGEGDVGA